MTPQDIEQMKADREAGTPGPWVVHNCESSGDRCTHYYQEIWNDDTDILVTTEVTRAHKDGGAANMRRIARVPDLEAEILRMREALGRIARADEGDADMDEYGAAEVARAALNGDAP